MSGLECLCLQGFGMRACEVSAVDKVAAALLEALALQAVTLTSTSSSPAVAWLVIHMVGFAVDGMYFGNTGRQGPYNMLVCQSDCQSVK